eukprot:6210050-Pleurochrysis_carterae.AAC.3
MAYTYPLHVTDRMKPWSETEVVNHKKASFSYHANSSCILCGLCRFDSAPEQVVDAASALPRHHALPRTSCRLLRGVQGAAVPSCDETPHRSSVRSLASATGAESSARIDVSSSAATTCPRPRLKSIGLASIGLALIKGLASMRLSACIGESAGSGNAAPAHGASSITCVSAAVSAAVSVSSAASVAVSVAVCTAVIVAVCSASPPSSMSASPSSSRTRASSVCISTPAPSARSDPSTRASCGEAPSRKAVCAAGMWGSALAGGGAAPRRM